MRRLNHTRCHCGHCHSATTETHTYWAVHTNFETAQDWLETINERRRK